MKKAFWERFAFFYDIAVKKGDAADRAAADYIAGFLAPDCRLLEAACGTGRFSRALAPKVERVSCCDYAGNMVRQAERKAAGLDNLDFSVQDITALRFADGSFDAALAANVLHLLPRPERAVAELVRVVRPGGLLIFPNYVNGESGRSDRRFLRLAGTLGFRPENEWTREQFLDFLRDRGLEVLGHRMFASREPMCVAVARAADGKKTF